MGIFALILGVLGGLCGVAGILDTAQVEPFPIARFDATSWFSLAIILLLASIVTILTRGPSD
jgi:hypothetical protein